MPQTVAAALGVLASVLALVAPLPYLRDVLAGRTRPHRTAWGISAAVSVLAFGAQAAHRVDWSLGLLAVQVSTLALTFWLSLSRGVGGAGTADVLALGVAAAGLIAWATSDDPVLALVGAVVAEAVAALVMLPKSWREPWSETWTSFLLSGLGAGCGALAVGRLDANLLYPGWYCVANLSLALVVVAGRAACARPDGPGFAPATRPGGVPARSCPVVPDGRSGMLGG